MIDQFIPAAPCKDLDENLEMSQSIVAPGQRVRYKAPKIATGVYDVLAVRDGRASLRGVHGTQWQGDHWSAQLEELVLV